MDKALCYAATGARGSGKTAWCVQEIGRVKPARLAVWDFKHDRRIGDGIRFTNTVGDIPSLARAMAARNFAVRYLVSHKPAPGFKDVDAWIAWQFDRFCEVCWLASQLLMYVAELPMVTSASHAPGPWRQCVNVGRDYTTPDGRPGWLAVMADGQRDSEMDKTFISNCDVVNAGRQAWPIDAKGTAERLGNGVTRDEVLQLPDLYRIEMRQGTPGVKRFVLSFGNAPEKKIESKAPRKRSPKRAA